MRRILSRLVACLLVICTTMVIAAETAFALTVDQSTMGNTALLSNIDVATGMYIDNLHKSNATINIYSDRITTDTFTWAGTIDGSSSAHYLTDGGIGIRTVDASSFTLGSIGNENTSVFRIRWANAGADGDGHNLDVELICYYLRVRNPRSDDFLWLFAMDETHNPQFESYYESHDNAGNIPSIHHDYGGGADVNVDMGVRLNVYQAGTNTPASGKFIMQIADLDGKPEDVWLQDGWQSPLYIRSDSLNVLEADNTYIKSGRGTNWSGGTYADDVNETEQARTGFTISSLGNSASFIWYGNTCHTRLDLDYVSYALREPTVKKAPDSQIASFNASGNEFSFDVTVNIPYSVAKNRPKALKFTDQLNSVIDFSSVAVSVLKGTSSVAGDWNVSINRSTGLIEATAKDTNAEAHAGVYGDIVFRITGYLKDQSDYNYSSLATVSRDGTTYGRFTNAASFRLEPNDNRPKDANGNPIISNVTSNTVEVLVARGSLSVSKVDADTKTASTQGDANDTFAGTTYEIVNKSGHAVRVNKASYANDARIMTIVAGTDGVAQTAAYVLPYGTYLVREITPVTGYLLSEPAWSRTFSITSQGQVQSYRQNISTERNEDPVIRGGVEIHKVDSDSKGTTPQGDGGSFAQTTYRVTNKSAHAVYIRSGNAAYGPYKAGQNLYAPGETCIEFSSNASGVASLPADALPYGTYLIEEVTPPEGYLNSGWGKWMVPENPDAPADQRTYVQWTVSIREDKKILVFKEEHNANGDVRNEEPIMRGGVTVRKVDADWASTAKRAETQGDAADTFEGTDGKRTEYQIFNKSKSYVYVDGVRYEANDSRPVLTIYANQDGIATSGDYILPYGTYLICETQAIEGYLIDPEWALGKGKTFTIRSNGYMEYFNDSPKWNADPVIRGGVEIHKYDADLLAKGQGANGATQGNAESFKGTKYVITTKSAHDVNVHYKGASTDFSYDDRCITFEVEGTDGVARVPADALPYGTYEVMELSPAPGYQNSYWRQEFEIREDGLIITFDDPVGGEHPRNVDEVDRGSVTVAKVDSGTGRGEPQGDASLQGAEYQIVNRSTGSRPVVVGGKAVAYGEVAATITSAASGLATTGSQALPYGTYDITETKAPYGYANSGWRQTFTIDHNSHDVSFIYDGNKNRETVITLNQGVQVRKLDADFGDGSPSGAATLEGAVFSLRNESAHPVLYRGQEFAVGATVDTLQTDATGTAFIVANTLPTGTYRIAEEFAPKGYLRNSTWSAVLVVDGEGNPSVSEVSCPDPVIRGDLRFRKVDSATGTGIPGIAFRIRSETTGESHIVVSGADGLVDTASANVPHTTNTNASDDGVTWEAVEGMYVVDSSKATAANGVWFSGRDGSTCAADDSRGALPYDTYVVEELRCDANRDYDLVQPFSFSVTGEGYANSTERVENSPSPIDEQRPEHGSQVTVYKDSDPAPNTKVKPGDVITYKVTARNTGAYPQPYTIVRDQIPQGTEYVAGSVQGGDARAASGAGYVEWKLVGMRPREERVLTFQVRVLNSAPQFIYNTALCDRVEGDFTPGDPSNPAPTLESNTVMHRTGDSPTPAFVRVTKTSVPAPGTEVAWNSEIEYSLRVTNTGGSTALMTGVFDLVPDGTELVDVATGDGFYSSVSGDWREGIGWLIPVLLPGEDNSVTLPFTVRVTDRELVRASGIVSNQASWGDLSNLDFPAPPERDLSNTTNIVEHPLHETPPETAETYKSSVPAPETVVKNGDVIKYVLTTVNRGASTKPYVFVRDYIPEGTAYKEGSVSDGGAYVAADAEGNASGKAYVEWCLTSVRPNAPAEVSFEVTVTEDWRTYIRDVALSETRDAPVVPGDPSNPDPAETTNEVKHRTPDAPEGDDLFPLVKVEKSSVPTPGKMVAIGREIEYSLDVTNYGKATAYEVRVYDAAPAGTRLTRVDEPDVTSRHTLPSQGVAGWVIDEMAAGSTVRLTFAAVVETDDVPTTSRDGRKVIRNRAAWSYENVPPEWAGDSDPPVGPEEMGNLTNVTEHPLAPTPPPQHGSYVTCYKDSDPAPNSYVRAGQRIEYRIVATNTGKVTQPATLIRDAIPDGTSYVEGTASDGGAYVSADDSPDGTAYVEWVLGPIAPQETKAVTFSVTVDDEPPTLIMNLARFAEVAPGTVPGDPENPGGGLPTNVVWHTTDEDEPTPAVVQVRKGSEPTPGSPVEVGDTIRYHLTVTNTGGAVAKNQGVWDEVPAGLSVAEDGVSPEHAGQVSEWAGETSTDDGPEGDDGEEASASGASPAVARSGLAVSWVIDEIAPGEEIDLWFDAVVSDPSLIAGDVIDNQASWGGVEPGTRPEGPLGNTTNIVQHVLMRYPVPNLVKTLLGRESISVGEKAAFRITVRNDGDAPMESWTLVDRPDPGLAYFSDEGQGLLRDDGTVMWSVDLAPGEERHVDITMVATPAAMPGVPLRNVAILTSPADDVIESEARVSGMSTESILLQTGVGGVASVMGIASGIACAATVARSRRRQA